MPLDLIELKRQSRIAAILTAVSSMIVLAALLFSYVQTNHAEQTLNQIRDETKLLTIQRDSLRTEIAKDMIVLRKLGSSPGLSGDALNKALKSTPSVAERIPRVSIEIAETRDRAEAERAADILKSKGYIVPDIIVEPKSNSARETSIRYFQNDAKTVADAKQIAEIVRQIGFTVKTEFDNEYVGTDQAPPPGQYEFWIGMNPSYRPTSLGVSKTSLP